MECHDCKIPLDFKSARFAPWPLDKWIRCSPCHERAKQAEGQRGQ
jgi:hypothetical protein